MIGGASVPNDLCRKVVLHVIVCATQLDGLVVIKVNGKAETQDVHMFGVNPSRPGTCECGEKLES